MNAGPRPAGGVVGRLRAVGLNSGVYLAGDVLVQGLAFLLFPLYTRALSPGEYGILAVTSTITVVLTLVLGMSLQAAVGRLHFEAGDEAERGRLYGTILVFLLVIPGGLVLGLEGLGRLGALDVFRDVGYEPYLRYSVFTAYLTIFLDLPVQIFISRERPVPVLLLTAANGFLIAGLTVLLVVVMDEGVIGALRAQLIGAGVIAIVSIGITVRMASFRPSRTWLFAALAFGLPLIPHALGQWVLQLSDRLLLEGLVSPEQLGLYSLGAAVGLAASFVAHATGRAFAPVFVTALKSETDQGLVPVLATYWLGALCFTFTGLALFLPDVVRILTTPEYHGATRVIPWIVFGFLAFGVYMIVSQGTFFAMRTRMMGALTVAAAVGNVGLNFLLVPHFGIVGSAAATLIAFLLLALFQGLLSHRLHPIPWEYVRCLKLLAATGVAFAIGSLGGGGTSATTLAAKFAALFLAFPLVVAATRFAHPGELDWLRARARAVTARLFGGG